MLGPSNILHLQKQQRRLRYINFYLGPHPLHFASRGRLGEAPSSPAARALHAIVQLYTQPRSAAGVARDKARPGKWKISRRPHEEDADGRERH